MSSSSGLSKRFTRMLGRSKDAPSGSDRTNSEVSAPAADDNSPEATAKRSVRLFCESANGADEEVLHLPVLVEAAASSPTAAAACVQQIREFLAKPKSMRPSVQYNAVMLIRILSDHPGVTFTRSFDKAFVGTVRDVLRKGNDQGTQQLLRETLDSFEVGKMQQPGVDQLVDMWRKEKPYTGVMRRPYPRAGPNPGGNPQQNVDFMPYPTPGVAYGQQGAHRTRLPPPTELASRVEEARNTAKILLQLISSTPTEEVLSNELIKEFRERCQSAQRSMESYINCENPAPDDETMLTLIETNEQLSLAATRYQRCVLSARKAMGMNPRPDPQALRNGSQGSNVNGNTAFANGQANSVSAFGNSNGTYNNSSTVQDFATGSRQPSQPENPFADPQPDVSTTTEPSISSFPTLAPLSFTINPEPSYPTTTSPSSTSGAAAPSNYPNYSNYHQSIPRRNTAELNSAYSAPTIAYDSNPNTTSSFNNNNNSLSPDPRAAYYNSTVTSSYTGRQNSAANGLTMHGGGGPLTPNLNTQGPAVSPLVPSTDQLSEMDGYSDVARAELDGYRGRSGVHGEDAEGEKEKSDDGYDGESAYSASPVEGRRR